MMNTQLSTLLQEIKPGDLVELGWFDAYFSEGWKDKDWMEDTLEEDLPGAPANTVGYYCGHNQSRMIVSMSQGSLDKSDYGEIYVIPLMNIAKLEVLKKSE